MKRRPSVESMRDIYVRYPVRELQADIGAAARTLFRLTGTPLKISSQSKIPNRAVILVVDHSSYLDGAVLSAAIPGELSFV